MAISSPIDSSAPGSPRQALAAIFRVSFLVLFFELIVIRWLSSEIQVFAWLKNLPLLCAFLGLGLGALTARGSVKVSPWFLWLFSGLALLLVASEPLRLEAIAFPDPSITTWHAPGASAASLFESFGGVATLGIFILVVGLVSAATVLMFVFLGQTLGAAMNRLPPLVAYSADLLGSLTGVLAFTLLSFLQTPPVVWVGVGMAALFTLLPRRLGVLVPLVGMIVVVAIYSVRGDVLWSPYYRVGYTPIPGQTPPLGYTITVNHHYHQQAVGLSDAALARNPHLIELRSEYELPFVVAARRDQVALLGAGTGNDAAAALRQGARRVVAVEIDPAIIQLGHRLHDEHPYESDRVEVVNTDARAWLRQTNERFDVVSFGLVDSHTLLSSMSSIRLESYLYTVESLQDVVRILAPDGVAAMSFVIGDHEWQGQRLFNTIERATGRAPIVLNLPNYGVSFVFGPGAEPAKVAALAGQYGFPIVTDRFGGQPVRPATDDWPFLYLNPNQQPVGYLLVLAVLLITGFVVVRRRMGGEVTATPLNVQMLFMGAAFLLIETKSIAELSLLFGSTWLVNAAVFAGILAMALAANQIVLRWARPNANVLYVLLVLSLLLGFVFPVSALNQLGLLERAVVGSALAALPIAFSGVVFATAFRLAPRVSVALGANLFGAIVGGALEASSMWLGIKSLSLIAAALYLCSWLALAQIRPVRERRRRPARVPN